MMRLSFACPVGLSMPVHRSNRRRPPVSRRICRDARQDDGHRTFLYSFPPSAMHSMTEHHAMLRPYQQPPLPPPTPFSSSSLSPSASSSSSYSPASCPPPPPSSSGPPSAGSYQIGSAMRELPGVVCRQWACPSNRWGGEGIMKERRGEERRALEHIPPTYWLSTCTTIFAPAPRFWGRGQGHVRDTRPSS